MTDGDSCEPEPLPSKAAPRTISLQTCIQEPAKAVEPGRKVCLMPNVWLSSLQSPSLVPMISAFSPVSQPFTVLTPRAPITRQCNGGLL